MEDENATIQSPVENPTGEIPIFYVKSNFYRVVHTDGIYGGGAPTPGNIIMTVFSHRVPLPEKSANDAFGNEIPEKRIARYGIENELEVSLVMELNTAKIMRQWLDNSIKNTENLLQRMQVSKQEK